MEKLELSYSESKTEVFFDDGLINKVSEIIKDEGKIFVISEKGVPEEYQRKVCSQFSNALLFLVPHSESAKSLSAYEECLIELQKHRFTKGDTIISLGGGVVGDLGGFVAATYLRGMRWIQIPTTTLSQIDSSIGGKTALNFGGIKNVIGSFWQPEKVLIDFEVLDTLEKRQFINGMIEALKIGLLFDENLVKWIKEDVYKNKKEIIKRAVQLKKEVVEKDEKDKNFRQLLNFGHTLGHAIESVSEGKLYHGECVGLAMLGMIEEDHIREEVREILRKMNCPISFKEDENKVIEKVFYDKKMYRGKLNLIFLEKIGQVKVEQLSWSDAKIKVRDIYEEHIRK